MEKYILYLFQEQYGKRDIGGVFPIGRPGVV